MSASPKAAATTSSVTPGDTPVSQEKKAVAEEASRAPFAPPARAPAAGTPAIGSSSPSPKKASSKVKEASLLGINVESNLEGLEQGKNQGNRLFSEGKHEEAALWFSKCLMICEKVDGVTAEFRSVLFSNRAFARIKLELWEDAAADCTSALELNENNVKARYRAATARLKIGQLDQALADVQAVLASSGEKANPDAEALKDEILKQIREKQQQRREEQVTKLTTGSARGSRAPQAPSTSPKNAYEMQRHFNSLKRHPTVLAEYVKKSIPPSLIPNLFKRSSIEPDALGQVITALRSSVETDPELGPSTCLAYLSALVRTYGADIQFKMLSEKELQGTRELLDLAPESEEKQKVKQALRGLL